MKRIKDLKVYWLEYTGIYWNLKYFCFLCIPLYEYRATSSGPNFSGSSNNCMCSLIFTKSMQNYPCIPSKEALSSSLMLLEISLYKLSISYFGRDGN